MIVGDVAEYVAPDGTWGCFGCGFYKDSAPTELDDAVFAQTALANFPPTGYSQSMNRKPADPLHETGHTCRVCHGQPGGNAYARAVRFFLSQLCHFPIPRRAAGMLVVLILLVWNSGCVSSRSTSRVTPLSAVSDEFGNAVASGDLEKGKALLKDDPNLVFVTFEGLTPLHLAAENDKKDMAELLLANMADVNAKDYDGNAPLHDTASQGFTEVAELLLDNKADVNARNNDGFTSLHVAVENDQKGMVEFLLANKADVNARDNDGRTPLYVAARRGNKDILYLLRQHGGQDTTPPDTALFDATWDGDLEKAQVLLRSNPELLLRKSKVIGFKGDTLLHWAGLYGYKDIVELLLTNGAVVNTKANDGWTPLHWAAYGGHKDVVELLLAHKANVNAKANDGWTPLHCAAWSCSENVAELLLAKGANVNAKNNDGWTPLHWAARNGCKDEVELLLAKGAEVNVKNDDGDTPLHFAENNVAELLRQHGGHE